MKIVLLGYMGSGKSTIGRLLAERLDHSFVDLDEHLEKAEGMSIAQIFDKKGEIYFRKKESHYVSELLTDCNDIILSLGGGTPCYGNNMGHILELTASVFYLKVSVNELNTRLLSEKSERPLIKNVDDEDLPEFIGKHIFERGRFYQKANYTIECDNKEPKIIASEIVEILV